MRVQPALTYEKPILTAIRDPRISAAIVFMEANLHRPLSVGVIARNIGVARSTLWNIWQKECLLGPSALLRALRMDRAGTLLAQSDLEIKEVAARVGIPRVAHFSRVFLAQYFESPSQFRRRVTQDQGGATEASASNS